MPPLVAPVATLGADVLAGLADLELAARLIVEGTRVGGHRSPFHGLTTEFAQHRSYRVGDDLKHLDWKLYARSDRLYTRQFRETTNFAATLVLDCSGSMDFPDAGVSKWRYASLIAASLAYLAAEQGNAAGLSTMVDGAFDHLPARGGRPHLRTLLARLSRLRPGGTFSGGRALAGIGRLLRRRGLVFLLSDCYDEEDALLREVRHLVQHGHEVTVLQLTSPDEQRLPASGPVLVEDLESGVVMLADPVSGGTAFHAAVTEFHERVRREVLRAGADHLLLSTDAPPAGALRRYLRQRRARAATR